MEFKKKHLFGALILGLGMLVFLSLNPLLESAAKSYLTQQLVLQQESAPYTLEFSDLDLNIFTQDLTLSGLSFIQTKEVPPKKQDAKHSGLRRLELSRAVIRGVNLSNFLWNRSLQLHTVELDTVRLTIYKKDNEGQQTTDTLKREGFLFDSIRLPGITRVSLGSFQLNYFESYIQNGLDGDTLSRLRSSDLRLEGIGLTESQARGAYTFVPEISNFELHLGRQDYLVGNGQYELVYRSLSYWQKGQNMRIDSIAFFPRIPPDSLSRLHPYSYERYKATASGVTLAGIELSRLLNTGVLHVSSVRIDSLDLEIFRDKTKPAKPNHTIPLPAAALRALEVPFVVDTVWVSNSHLEYYERLPETDQHVAVAFNALEGRLYNLRSNRYALPSGEPLRIHLETNLLEALPFTLDLEFPYGSNVLRMTGQSLGSSSLSALNPTVFPALNLKFGHGRLDRISFEAIGNANSMKGVFTMLYSDLEVVLFKADHQENKVLSWMANSIVRQSNPNRRGRTRVAEISAERDPGKGAMNYVWKGIQSGVINTFNPLGRHRKK